MQVGSPAVLSDLTCALTSCKVPPAPSYYWLCCDAHTGMWRPAAHAQDNCGHSSHSSSRSGVRQSTVTPYQVYATADLHSHTCAVRRTLAKMHARDDEAEDVKMGLEGGLPPVPDDPPAPPPPPAEPSPSSQPGAKRKREEGEAADAEELRQTLAARDQ